MAEVVAEGDPSADVVLDVGANIGYFSLLFLSQGYRVVSFEPNLRNRVRVERSLAINGFGGRSVLRGNTVSDRAGQRHVMSSQSGAVKNFGGSSAHIAAATDVDGVVTSTTLDVECTTAGAQEQDAFRWDQAPVQLLKMDIEGFEPSALAGAADLIASRRVKYIVTECTIYDEAKLAAYLSVYVRIIDAGYHMYNLGLKESGTVGASRPTLSSLKAEVPLARSEVEAFLRTCNFIISIIRTMIRTQVDSSQNPNQNHIRLRDAPHSVHAGPRSRGLDTVTTTADSGRCSCP
eukprot:COSAG01_NODE_2491_length_7583_cov_32.473944_2_plen_291_part_00